MHSYMQAQTRAIIRRWKAEIYAVSSLLHLHRAPRIEFRAPTLHTKCLYPLCHLVRPPKSTFYNLLFCQCKIY